MLFSVHWDGNLQLNFAIFYPYWPYAIFHPCTWSLSRDFLASFSCTIEAGLNVKMASSIDNFELKVGMQFPTFHKVKTLITSFFVQNYHPVRPDKKECIKAYSSRVAESVWISRLKDDDTFSYRTAGSGWWRWRWIGGRCRRPARRRDGRGSRGAEQKPAREEQQVDTVYDDRWRQSAMVVYLMLNRSLASVQLPHHPYDCRTQCLRKGEWVSEWVVS